MKACSIDRGRSTWEDHIDKAEFIVVKEVGPAMAHYKEAMESEPSERQSLASRLTFMANPNEYNSRTCEFLNRCAELILEKEKK